MYSKIFLAGTLAIILFGGLNVTPAFAQQALVDDFTETNAGAADTVCSITIADPGGAVPATIGPNLDSPLTSTNAIGGDRECTTQVTFDGSGQALANCMTEIAPLVPIFTLDSGSMLDCNTTLKYGSQAQLNEDWSGFAGSPIRLDIIDTDASNARIFSLTVTLVSGNGAGSHAFLMTTQISGPQTIDFPLNTFVANGVDLSDIDMITVLLDPEDAGDFDLKKIFIPVLIGGTIMPADSTALLLAGAELNAIWILPAIAAIGIGAFVVSRKRN